MARTVATLPVGNRITDFISLGVIAKTFPVDKVHAILRATGKTSVRQRDLPVGDPAGTSRTSRPSPQQARGQTQDEQLPAPAPNRQTAAACRHPKGDQDTKVNRIASRAGHAVRSSLVRRCFEEARCLNESAIGAKAAEAAPLHEGPAILVVHRPEEESLVVMLEKAVVSEVCARELLLRLRDADHEFL